LLLFYFFIMFTGSFLLSWKLGQTYEECATMAFTAAGNNFELALAVSISVYHPDSHQAFTCIIGPLVEIPVMLALVHLAFFFQRRLTFKGTSSVDWAGLTDAP
jgi:ACR3 family arsenite transporter